MWSAAAAYADADPDAADAARKCEERLRALHPYAMAWYDRLRSEGAGALDAMREALPLFARAPYARPGGPGRGNAARAAGVRRRVRGMLTRTAASGSLVPAPTRARRPSSADAGLPGGCKPAPWPNAGTR